MLSLKEIFGEQGRFARQETMRQIYNTKMAEGSSVRGHCLTMISNLNTLEVLGADIEWRISSGYDTPIITRII